MKSKKILLALIIIIFIFAICIGYRCIITSENIQTKNVILSGVVLDEPKLFHLEYLEQYSGSNLILDIKKGHVRISVENRFTLTGEYVYLREGKSYTLNIDHLIQKYQNHIGLTVHPVDKRTDIFSLSYKIISD